MATNLNENFINSTLNDIKVELLSEFDRNFERQAFFNQAWKKRSTPSAATRAILINTGALRQSLKANITQNGVVFSSVLPYAAIHNNGGTIRVTKRMKAYFFHRFKETVGAMSMTKKGAFAMNKKNRTLTPLALFYRSMALKKEGSQITIPPRRFLGNHQTVEQKVKNIITTNIKNIYKKL